MGAPAQPPMAWKYCGDQIKRWRAQAGVTREELSRAANYDIESVRSMEAGRRKPSRKLLETADELCNARGMLLGAEDFLIGEKRAAKSDTYLEVEEEAIAIYSYQPLYIPGLLQTEEYARATVGFTIPPIDQETIEARIRSRLARQTKLTNRPTTLFCFVLYEAALHTCMGGPGTMKRQLHHLLEAGQSRNVKIQILPIANAIPPALSGSLMILETINNEHYAYVETHETNALHTDPELVGKLSRRQAMIRAQSLSAEGSATMIRKVAEQL